ncbi:MAG: hypothetical protein GX591_14415, partial [Planctomycetes bacterium]|nr:hypothetical protein [Planctomycetota bacterium]
GWGYSVELLERGPDARVTWSRWTLQSDRREGDYRSQVGVLRRGRPLADRVVEIEYDAPRVVIRNTGLGLRATAEVGADYIPEGRLEPLIADVARTGEAVQGTLAADAQRAVVPVVIEPEGRVSYRLNGRPVELTAVRLTWPSADAGAAAGRFLVDDGGSIAVQQLLDPQGHVVQTFERASLKQVRLHYPRAHVLRNQVLEATEEE